MNDACPATAEAMTSAPRLILVTGLSGAGKSSILRALEDLGYEAIDNPPLSWLDRLIAERTGPAGGRKLALGIDVRTSGFDPDRLLAVVARLRADPALCAELVFALAEETSLLRRYTETRRRHPLAAEGRVMDGITAEQAMTTGLRHAADLVIDTSDLTLAGLRHVIEQRFGGTGLLPTVALLSFAFPAGLPREADMVFDARFLRNPHYDQALKALTGLDAPVSSYIEADPDFSSFFERISGLLNFLLPRFAQEGKKYLTVAVGCTGGKHRSVHLVEKLARHLAQRGHAENGSQNGSFSTQTWRITTTHRELARHTGPLQRRSSDSGNTARAPSGVSPRGIRGN